ncbi:MAG: hypothetical protein ACOYNN_12525 [Terrimicrobiaceae bacterium]|jgi:type II secretory pathway pseudopilin PulG
MTTSTASSPRSAGGYTLLEILLALGLVAILLGVTIPMVAGGFGTTPADEATESLSRTASAARTSALESSESRRLFVTEKGLSADLDAIPKADLPPGWKLQVRRMTESKFRKPNKGEFWEFNGAGICEPVTFLVGDGLESVTLTFDPLTALVVPDE